MCRKRIKIKERAVKIYFQMTICNWAHRFEQMRLFQIRLYALDCLTGEVRHPVLENMAIIVDKKHSYIQTSFSDILHLSLQYSADRS